MTPWIVLWNQTKIPKDTSWSLIGICRGWLQLIVGVEGCLCGKLGFPEEVKAPPPGTPQLWRTPQRPRTLEGTLSSTSEGTPQKARLRIPTGRQHGVRLQMGNGPRHRSCGEGKYLAANYFISRFKFITPYLRWGWSQCWWCWSLLPVRSATIPMSGFKNYFDQRVPFHCPLSWNF